MGKKILFSPVGGTDPISQNNFRDGSMLHICRVYKPDIVYLYMSGEMLVNQEQDDRYRYCLHQMEKRTGHSMEIREIERPDLMEVQNFDYFYNDFRQILREISGGADSEDTILLNVSSGTPQMKSGLLVLVTLGEFECRAIQVSTPVRKMNEHNHEGFDPETAWELDEDNRPDFENRCQEVRVPSLLRIKNEEIIKTLVKKYDYRAAIEVAKLMPGQITRQYMPLLKMAENRELLDYSRAMTKAAKYHLPKEVFPVQSSDAIKYFEYLLNVEIKRRKGEYADFLRALTPLIADLMWNILKKQCGIDLDDYIYIDDNNVKKWDRKKLTGSKIERPLQERYHYNFRGGMISSDHMDCIINYISKDPSVKRTAHTLRQIDSVRNIPAHQICSVTDEFIREKTGCSSLQIVDIFKKALAYAGFNFKPEWWDAYDHMNEQIIGRMQ